MIRALLSACLPVVVYLPLAAQQAEQAKPGRIEGKTVHALTGSPVRRANVLLRRAETQPQQGTQPIAASSDEEGKFVFENVEPGTYRLSAERTGFLRSEFGARRAGNFAPLGTTITVPASGEPSPGGREPAPAARPSVKAPLTGIFYASPAPGTAPYVSVGGEVAVGQVIGLIEAMKLFNEIKSDASGRITRILVENGTLVKRKQPLLEVDPR